MDLSNLLEVPANLSEATLDGSDPGDLFDGELFNFDIRDDVNGLPQNIGDGAAAQGGGRTNYEPPIFFPFHEMPPALKPRPSHFPNLRKVVSGALNVGNLCEASDKALLLLLELDRALQLFTSQQQFLIEQVQTLDQWLKHMCPNAKTHQVEGFNVSELLTLDDMNILENIPEGLLRPEMPPSKQKHKVGASQLNQTSKSLSNKTAVADNIHVSNIGQVKRIKWNELSKSANRTSQESTAEVVGISRQRKKEKNSNVSIVNGGGSSVAPVRTTLASKKQQLQSSSLATAESGHSTRLIKVKIKCKNAESLVANPLFAQIPTLMSESLNMHEAAPSSNGEKTTSLSVAPKIKFKEETPRKKAEDAQPPTVKGMWDWVRMEGYFKECTGTELYWADLQPEYISPKLAPGVKKPPFSKSSTLTIKPSERHASFEYACPSAHIMTDAGDSKMHTSNGKHNNFFTDRLISALLPTKQQHSKNTVLLNPPVETTVQDHSELDLDALTEEQRLNAYLCNVGLLSTQFLEGWQGHHDCVDELQMLTEVLGRLNCRNNQSMVWLKEQVCKEVEKQRICQIEQADSMAKIQRVKELMKCKKKQKIGEQQQKKQWPW